MCVHVVCHSLLSVIFDPVSGHPSCDALRKFALPSGSLQDATVDLFARANFNIEFKPRDYFPDVDDPEIGFISFRAQEVSRYVEAGGDLVVEIGLENFEDVGLVELF